MESWRRKRVFLTLCSFTSFPQIPAWWQLLLPVLELEICLSFRMASQITLFSLQLHFIFFPTPFLGEMPHANCLLKQIRSVEYMHLKHPGIHWACPLWGSSLLRDHVCDWEEKCLGTNWGGRERLVILSMHREMLCQPPPSFANFRTKRKGIGQIKLPQLFLLYEGSGWGDAAQMLWRLPCVSITILQHLLFECNWCIPSVTEWVLET